MWKIYYEIDMDFITVDDYTVYLKNSNKNLSEEKVRQILGNDQKIIKINKVYKISDIYHGVEKFQ